jgi:hypothetical protein
VRVEHEHKDAPPNFKTLVPDLGSALGGVRLPFVRGVEVMTSNERL